MKNFFKKCKASFLVMLTTVVCLFLSYQTLNSVAGTAGLEGRIATYDLFMSLVVVCAWLFIAGMYFLFLYTIYALIRSSIEKEEDKEAGFNKNTK